jgi:nucleotide-binding universal stress UspA family protein
MDVKDLLLFLEAGEPCGPQLDLALALAVREGATLTGLAVCHEPPIDPADCYAIGPQGVVDVLARREETINRGLAVSEAAFRAAVAERGLAGEWAPPSLLEAPDDLALHARWFDLAVVGAAGGADSFSHRLAEAVALTSGAPCLVAPKQGRAAAGFDTVVVAWDGSRAARRALADGLVFLRPARRVRLAVVGGDPAEAAAEASIEAILRHLARHGVEAGLDRIAAGHAGAGAALLEHCAASSADLLIMGAYGHARALERVLGGVTRTILTRATLPVLLSH